MRYSYIIFTYHAQNFSTSNQSLLQKVQGITTSAKFTMKSNKTRTNSHIAAWLHAIGTALSFNNVYKSR
jgi:hypothetical protein